ncbi:MAG: hypothetical protein C0485_16885 [Pirellula sp.]|nr:hypothetical protein [Pirellula sp.]
MKLATRVSGALLSFCALSASQPAGAVDTTWTAAVNNDFYNNGNWDTGVAPTAADNALILNPTVTASINFAGTRDLGSFHLGTNGATGGNVDFSAGTLNVHADFNRSHIGDQNSLNSKFVMRGTAVMLYDEPLDGAGAGLGSPGGNQDLEIGAQTGASGSLGLLELHDSAILRISDDLKIGAEANGNGEVLIDGNARISTGSGISISESNPSKGKMTVGGSALVVSGNSAGAGNAAQGFTDEGYFTLSVNGAATADMVIKDSGKVYARTLQQRGGVSNFTIQDNGEFHIFDTFNFATPNLGVSTLVGDPFGPQRASHVGQSDDAQFNLLITGNGKMSIDAAVDDGSGLPLRGLSVSGGDNRGTVTGSGGASKIELRDNASFVIQQNLYMTPANASATANSTLRVVGPNVGAQIKGDLLMSYDPVNQLQSPGQSTLTAVITGGTHSTIQVGGEAKIEFGNLAVELSGYAPQGGETYTLLTANSITGTSFLNPADFTLAPLASGLTWDLNVGATSVVLKVLGSIALPGDFDSDQDVDGADFLKWQRNFGTPGYDAASLATWKANFGAPATIATGAVPEPCTAVLGSLAVGAMAAYRRRAAR